MKRMRWIFISMGLLALLAACAAPQPEATPELDPNVVGGRDANIEDYPWMAGMVSAFEGVADTTDLDIPDGDYATIDEAPDENELLQFCGGSLIDETWILSAAHCFSEPGVRLSYEGADGEASAVGTTDAIVVEDDKFYDVPSRVAFEGLTGDVEYVGEVVFFFADNPEDDIDTTCATNDVFEEAVAAGQTIAVEAVNPETLEEAQALAQELGQENCSEEEIEASYLFSLEGDVVEIVSLLVTEDEPDARDITRARNTGRSAGKQDVREDKVGLPLPAMSATSRRVFLSHFVQEAPVEEDLAVAAFLEALRAEGSVNVSYSPELLVDDADTVSIMMGSESINVGEFRASGGETVGVEEILVHPKYSPISIGLSYDYALLRLERPVDRPTIALSQEEIAGGVATSVTGWGYTEGLDLDDTEEPEEADIADLQVADNIRTLSDAECQARAETLNSDVVFPNPFDVIAPTILCTDTYSQEEDRELDSCGGDSGGPLFREEEGDTVQVGIVSFGYAADTDCGGEGGIAGYARVSAGLTWINRTMDMSEQ